MANLYVNLHVLQDVPPSNLNRDDSGSPKSARYGGVERLRVSSQAWKRAIRLDFLADIDRQSLGVRTRRVNETIREALNESGVPADVAASLTVEILAQIGIKAGKKDDETAYLLFFSRPQVVELVEATHRRPDLWEDPKALAEAIRVREALGHGHSLDVALFGRMVADLPAINVDAAVQVSHALATHAAPTQFDYFTAVDDAQESDETGAGMIGTVEFNSATLYRYAALSVPALIDNMGESEPAVAGVEQFVRSFVRSMPTGKQNTFAAHTRPGLVLIEVRDDRPVNYMSAFEEPVLADGRGYLAQSVARLNEFVGTESDRWGDQPLLRINSAAAGLEVGALGSTGTMDELLKAVRAAVDEAS
ncbi:type I-E CRISPR-associated protein Cas7/Cse4/CasC [Parenemella sanctibonifatiensis]|uniref:Type I-E CRISPR-associated protein Cas7/Cse4/CasC n=1 Tax=Parenemella sanctibonifatiensis TaxID=2016505 RepID=A0A255EMT1_9ACTN|nr:type I-E CRISPR-associated protein Cas7/Cse4/CasC [Parenemella sanctibonifatiensis]OYN89423.1 type I-E CRISPR-associated protein Cas7/Cse4/CasC [Parenemella sanctibonifatiensis]